MKIIFIRTIILYALIVASMRLMGKRTVGELQTSELAITLLIADLASVSMQDTGVPLLAGVIPIAVLCTLEIFMSWAMMKIPGASRLFDGRPVVVIFDGKLRQDALRDLRMTVEDLFESLRQEGIFDISEVSCAVFETSGKMSVMRKGENMRALLVSDGQTDEHSMKLLGWTDKKISAAAKENGIAVSDIFIMTGGADGGYSIIRKERKEKESGKA